MNPWRCPRCHADNRARHLECPECGFRPHCYIIPPTNWPAKKRQRIIALGSQMTERLAPREGLHG